MNGGFFFLSRFHGTNPMPGFFIIGAGAGGDDDSLGVLPAWTELMVLAIFVKPFLTFSPTAFKGGQSPAVVVVVVVCILLLFRSIFSPSVLA